MLPLSASVRIRTIMQVEYLAPSLCLIKACKEARSLSPALGAGGVASPFSPPPTSHVSSRLTRGPGKPGVPFHPPLLNRCHGPAWIFKSAGTRLSWEEKKPCCPPTPPFHTHAPRSLWVALEVSVEAPTLVLSFYRWGHGDTELMWEHRIQGVGLGS